MREFYNMTDSTENVNLEILLPHMRSIKVPPLACVYKFCESFTHVFLKCH